MSLCDELFPRCTGQLVNVSVKYVNLQKITSIYHTYIYKHLTTWLVYPGRACSSKSPKPHNEPFKMHIGLSPVVPLDKKVDDHTNSMMLN